MSSPVAVPDPEVNDSRSPHGLKRRQSDAEQRDGEGKRPRVNASGDDTRARNAADATDRLPEPSTNAELRATKDEASGDREPRRKEMGADEKQRGKRLFGALLGNLNQPSDRVAKRRQEIESRRKAELQRQDEERLEDKQRRLERLVEHRETVQQKVNEENMRTRHRHMLHAANSLQTLAEPRLYYRPWDLRPDEEDRIAEQLWDSRAQIDRELQRTENDESEDPRHTRDDNDPTTNDALAASNEADTELPDTNMTSVDTGDTDADAGAQAKFAEDAQRESTRASNSDCPDPTNTASPSPASSSEEGFTGKSASKARMLVDDEGDHVVEGDEDTVIY